MLHNAYRRLTSVNLNIVKSLKPNSTLIYSLRKTWANLRR